jgi:drug/metabolite transporter (DMT)-like permease
MFWFIIAVSSYFIFAVASLIDKYLLAGPVGNPKVYAFYIGVLGTAALFLIPFIDFRLLEPKQLFFAFIAGGSFTLALFWFFKGLKSFELSRIIPAVGGILPIFTFLLISLFSRGRETLGFLEMISLGLLILGSVLISYDKSKRFSLGSLRISAIAAFLFAFSFVFSKYVYLEYPFLLGLIWIKLGGALAALALLLDRQLRKELFGQKAGLEKKTAAIFISGQALGAGAGILQNWAVALAPLIYLALVNALQGIQYVFLLAFVAIFFKKEISKETIFQKIIAILLIGAGLALLVL